MGIIGNILEAQRSTAALPLAGGVLTGNVVLGDNIKALFGTGSDASIYYDGTNLIINPKEVGSGVLSVLGNILLSGYLSLLAGSSIRVSGTLNLTNLGDTGYVGLTCGQVQATNGIL